MPGVSILPQLPAIPSFEPQSPSNSFQTDDLSIPELKKFAQASVRELTQGASALALINTARAQYSLALKCENDGDLKGALVGFIKAATLAQSIFGTKEYGSDSVKKELSVSFKELLESKGGLTDRLKAVEEKLRALEKQQQQQQHTTPSDGPVSKPGGSIADRMRSLQSNGLAIQTANKRVSTSIQKPASPASPATRLPPPSPGHTSTSALPPPSPITIPAPIPPSSSSPGHSPGPHSFVSPSTLGPPSPSSSPSSSPTVPNYSLSEFKSHFPSIDELDENPTFSLPSVPTGLLKEKNSITDLGSGPIPISPIPSFALRDFDPLERPSSTPITHITNAFPSRPASPAKPLGVPVKPSGLSSSISSSPRDDPIPISRSPSSLTSAVNRTTIPNRNTCTPKELAGYLKEYKVLLLDVRHRQEFDRERIKTDAPVVCVEPQVLGRGDLTAQKIEDSMIIAPTSESTSFANRNKFELVVLYDQNSTSYESPASPLSALQSAIAEKEFRKSLRRMPMLLVGGLDAWKKDIGMREVTGSVEGQSGHLLNGAGLNGIGSGYGSGSGTPSLPSSTSPTPSSGSMSSPPLKSRNPFAAGGSLASSPVISASSSLNGMSSASSTSTATMTTDSGPHIWTPRSRADTTSVAVGSSSNGKEHRSNQSLDYNYSGGHARSPAESNYAPGGLNKRPGIRGVPSSSSLSQTIAENSASPSFSPTSTGTPISYPSFARHTQTNDYSSPSSSSTSLHSYSQSQSYPHSSVYHPSPSPFASASQFDITSPPQASINPSLSRRRSDYIDQSQEALSGLQHARSPIEYPELSLSSQHILRPPPAAASNSLVERQSARQSSLPPTGLNGTALAPPVPPRIPSDWPVRYWPDSPIGTSGLKNLGNTCYMNAPIQCLSATAPFARFFTEGRWKNAVNTQNKMGSKGALTGGFAQLLRMMWSGDMPYLTPADFRRTVCLQNSQYNGTDQHDSQEFLSFLLDGIHEDLNRILVRPNNTRTPEEEEKLERLPAQVASEQEWKLWRESNDSVIVDYFQGQFRNQLRCRICDKTSTTYNAFSILSVPIHGRSGKVPLQRCLDAFFNTEVLEKDDAWDCPRCKTKRTATKQLSLARLPPILVIHLKRFEANGRFSDKIDTFVDFPLRSLDMTGYMPPPLPAGVDAGGAIQMGGTDDPRTQVPPYKYDLYGVTNHVGNLSSGHYTAFVASRGGWMYCDDSVIKSVDSKQVVSQKAYVLFYKRTRT
ncbi:hypothetical protein K435DRAFT_345687 [Dendrothele bispora CBS 962.96]|uniref:ubiquitinyl hydrolase 1 n=1 Tax=Dendrothele bispora (strain CBS 962.96) TaxID=1314807 RepID=A0A4S8MK22_DENBC|nr:hypothetical protein K435DRAFT_345687 [Dendrothele bispora CBS 962.96]